MVAINGVLIESLKGLGQEDPVRIYRIAFYSHLETCADSWRLVLRELATLSPPS